MNGNGAVCICCPSDKRFALRVCGMEKCGDGHERVFASSIALTDRALGIALKYNVAVPRSRKKSKDFDYDVCLSFAGENRRYVSAVAKQLRAQGLRTFYDEHEQIKLWGKDLYSHLDDVYRNAARYCVLFISKQYAKRLWTNHERRSAQARAFAEHQEYILPVRFDQTRLPGLPSTIGYLSLTGLVPAELAKLIIKKVGRPRREYYVPATPNRLFERLKVRSARSKSYVSQQAEAFVEALRRTSEAERKLVFSVFLHGCPSDLPMNIHISTELLRRITSTPASQYLRELRLLGSLGFTTRISPDHVGDADESVVELAFEVRTAAYTGPLNATGTVNEMILSAFEHYCESCAHAAIMRGDFSHLAEATAAPETHAAIKRKRDC